MMDELDYENTAFDQAEHVFVSLRSLSLSPSCLCIQALREPAAFAKSTGCESEIPHEKLTITQARRGTPGHTSQ